MKNRKYYFIITCVIVLFVHKNTQAQYTAYSAGLIYNSSFNNLQFLQQKSMLNRTFDANKERHRSKNNLNTKSNTTNVSVNNLNFTPATTAHDSVVSIIARATAKGDANKEKMNKQELNNAGILPEFNKALSQYGLSSHNLADIYTAYIIFSWESVTGKDAAKFPSGIKAFAQDMRNTMGSNAAKLNLSNMQKQETSELLAYIATLSYLSTQDLAKKGDTKTLNQYRTNMNAITTKITGMDISKYNLSDSGFGE